MDTALCTIDNTRYDIATFSKLDEQKLSNLRRALVCQECHAQGYYRKASRDGKHACFGAYHKDDCQYKTQGSKSGINPEVAEEIRTITVNNQIIDVKFDLYEPEETRSPNRSVSEVTTASNRTPKQHTRASTQTKHAQRGLKSLLKLLMHTDTFASSDIEINTGAKHPFKAKNLFIHFNDISDEYLEKWRGYWGVISHANSDISWLNVANERDVSIVVDKLKGSILKRHKTQSAEELADAAVLVFGRLKISANGKWYIKIDKDNPQHIFVKIRK